MFWTDPKSCWFSIRSEIGDLTSFSELILSVFYLVFCSTYEPWPLVLGAEHPGQSFGVIGELHWAHHQPLASVWLTRTQEPSAGLQQCVAPQVTQVTLDWPPTQLS